MPDMDFRTVLRSRRFQDNFDLISTRRTVNLHGVAIDTTLPEQRDLRGIVIPGKLSLIRAADGARVNAYIEIYTEIRLSAGTKTSDERSLDADMVRWHGRLYTVMETADFSSFGRGWIKASCDLLNLSVSSEQSKESA